jgi:hypothetical protein
MPVGRLDAGSRTDDRWQRARVWLDDQEVTHDCFMADDVLGNVGLFVRDHHGRIRINGWGNPEEEFRHGVVRIELPTGTR